MNTLFRISLVLTILSSSLLAWPAEAMPVQSNCIEGTQGSDALYLICLPDEQHWNGNLVVFAHGYVAFNEPIQIPDLELPDGTYLPSLVNRLGYAFATTSFSTNGLAMLEGINDLLDLVEIFSSLFGEPGLVYLTGGSEGGLITTLAVEGYPEIFAGGLAACGPIGNFRQQINYWGDFRVIFDYFFPEILPGSPDEIPDEVMENWETKYVPDITSAVNSDPHATDLLLKVTGAPFDEHEPESKLETILGLLWYNVFATNDGITKLGGQPFGNTFRIYTGSENDLRLNRMVERFRAEANALHEIETKYQTSGELDIPLVTLHTTGDPIIPYWHMPRYRIKVAASDSRNLFFHIPVLRYGHCEFRTVEVLAAFAVLVLRTTGQDLEGVEKILTDPLSMDKYLQIIKESANQ